jgi:phage terminase Nu1 subunit (DNA packaging protein)
MISKSSLFLVKASPLAGKVDSRALTSWKEIAFYMGRSVRTVQRWQVFGMPVWRPSGTTHKASIIAYTDELNSWAVAHYWRTAAAPESLICLLQQERLALPQRVQAYIRQLEARLSNAVGENRPD